MNKLLKTTGIFILGIGLMTGCTDKVAQKIDSSNNNVTSEATTIEETPTSLANLQKEVDDIKQTDTNINTNIINNKPTDQIATLFMFFSPKFSLLVYFTIKNRLHQIM